MQDKPILVAFFSNGPGHGKTTAAKMVNELAIGRTIRFSDTLKAMTRKLLACAGVNPTDIEAYIHDPDLKNNAYPLEHLGIYTTTRQIQQTLGEEWGRQCIHDDLWVNITENMVGNALNGGVSVTIDDMRYPNEMEMVKRLGGYPVFIHSDIEKLDYEHASEGQLDYRDAFSTIDNRSMDYEDLWSKVMTVLGIIYQRENPDVFRL